MVVRGGGKKAQKGGVFVIFAPPRLPRYSYVTAGTILAQGCSSFYSPWGLHLSNVKTMVRNLRHLERGKQ